MWVTHPARRSLTLIRSGCRCSPRERQLAYVGQAAWQLEDNQPRDAQLVSPSPPDYMRTTSPRRRIGG